MDETTYDAQKRFQEQLAFGQIAEWQIEVWLRRAAGCCVLPVREGGRDNQGPRIFLPIGNLIAPDMLVIKGKDVRWIEAKHKTVFSWHRMTHRWTTGIDLRAYEQYQEVASITPWPVWLLFLHSSSDSKERSEPCPTGLFGGELSYLTENENHRSDRWGRSGMVYWAHETLRLIATKEEIDSAVAELEAA